MASMVASIPVTGAIASLAGCRSGRGSFVDRLSFESVEANPSGRLIVRQTRDVSGRAFGRREANSSSRFAARAAVSTDEITLSSVVFEPFAEVQSFLSQLPEKANVSLARQRFPVSCESAVNEQINVEYNASYIYHALYAYFDRDDVALPGLAKYFKESSEEEREHAEKFMAYQNQRGGRVKLLSIVSQPTEFANSEKGDALYAMELTLSLEKLVTEKLYNLHKVAEDAGDIHLADFVEGEWLTEQIESIRKISGFVSQLRRIGNDGHGVVYWDRELLEEGAEGA